MANSKSPPPLPQRPQVDVWEYLGDGLWGNMGQAFPNVGTDPFWVLLLRILPWWPEGHDDIGSIPPPVLEEESSYNLLNA